MNEPVTLAALHAAVLDHLRGRTDTVVFGAQAVNAYVDEPRMTGDVDVMALDGAQLAEDLRELLAERFQIAARVREVVGGLAFRVYQRRAPKNRHLVDVRQVAVLPPCVVIAGVQVPTPDELIAEKVIAWSVRRRQPKGGTDWRDIAMLLLLFPELHSLSGAVSARLSAAGVPGPVLDLWKEICLTTIEAPDSEDVDEDDG